MVTDLQEQLHLEPALLMHEVLLEEANPAQVGLREAMLRACSDSQGQAIPPRGVTMILELGIVHF